MNKIFLSLSISLIAILAVMVGVKAAHANPSFFLSSTMSAAATSTVTQIISPGVATSTLTFDSMSLGRPYAADTATLIVQMTASSTSSVANIAFQYSQNGIDWADNNLTGTSTLANVEIQNPASYKWTATATATTTKAITIPVPTRYVRVKIGATGANSFIWDQIVPKQEAL